MRRGAWACGLLAWAPCGVAGATLARDVAALEAVRDAWGSAALGSWAAGTDPCGSPGWSGVTCGASAVVDGATAVTRLEVADVARDRLWELPEAAGNLTELEWLVLNDVGLTGTFPGATLARLASVEVLSLSYNYLSGPLDDTLFLGCTKLKRLSLDWNQLEAAGPTAALPAAAAGLQALISLKLGHNLLAGALPVELAALPALTSFSVEHNALEGPLPPFGTLYTLSVSHNLGLCGDVSVEVTSGVDRSGTCLGYPCGTPSGECEQDSRGGGGRRPVPLSGREGKRWWRRRFRGPGHGPHRTIHRHPRRGRRLICVALGPSARDRRLGAPSAGSARRDEQFGDAVLVDRHAPEPRGGGVRRGRIPGG